MITLRIFFPQIWALFPIFQKMTVETPPRPPPLARSSYSPVARYSEDNFVTEYIIESTLRAILKYIFMYTYIEIHTFNSKPM